MTVTKIAKPFRGSWQGRPATVHIFHFDARRDGKRVVFYRGDDGRVDVRAVKGSGPDYFYARDDISCPIGMMEIVAKVFAEAYF